MTQNLTQFVAVVTPKSGTVHECKTEQDLERARAHWAKAVVLHGNEVKVLRTLDKKEAYTYAGLVDKMKSSFAGILESCPF